MLLRQLRAVTMSFITLLLPFGALVFGATLYDERITARAVGGAALVAAGLLIAQMQRGRWPRPTRPRPGSGKRLAGVGEDLLGLGDLRLVARLDDLKGRHAELPDQRAQVHEVARDLLAGVVPGAAERVAIVRDVAPALFRELERAPAGALVRSRSVPRPRVGPARGRPSRDWGARPRRCGSRSPPSAGSRCAAPPPRAAASRRGRRLGGRASGGRRGRAPCRARGRARRRAGRTAAAPDGPGRAGGAVHEVEAGPAEETCR